MPEAEIGTLSLCHKTVAGSSSGDGSEDASDVGFPFWHVRWFCEEYQKPVCTMGQGETMNLNATWDEGPWACVNGLRG